MFQSGNSALHWLLLVAVTSQAVGAQHLTRTCNGNVATARCHAERITSCGCCRSSQTFGDVPSTARDSASTARDSASAARDSASTARDSDSTARDQLQHAELPNPVGRACCRKTGEVKVASTTAAVPPKQHDAESQRAASVAKSNSQACSQASPRCCCDHREPMSLPMPLEPPRGSSWAQAMPVVSMDVMWAIPRPRIFAPGDATGFVGATVTQNVRHAQLGCWLI
jgi:hypothetical protein